MPGHTPPSATPINILEEAGMHDKAVCPHVVSPEAQNVQTEIMFPQTCYPCVCLKNDSMIPPRSSKSKPIAVLDLLLSPLGTESKNSLDSAFSGSILSSLSPPPLACVGDLQTHSASLPSGVSGVQAARVVFAKCTFHPVTPSQMCRTAPLLSKQCPALDLVLQGLALPASRSLAVLLTGCPVAAPHLGFCPIQPCSVPWQNACS